MKTIATETTYKDGTFVMSTSNVDRDGDRVEQNWKMGKQIPLLVFHDWNTLPVGKITAIKSEDGRTTFQPEWANEKDYPFAGTVRKLCESGFMPAVSPGFRPISEKEKLTPEEKAQLGPGGKWITESELLEVSLVNIPANAEALLQANGAKMCGVFKGEAPVREMMTKGLKREAVEAWAKDSPKDQRWPMKPARKKDGMDVKAEVQAVLDILTAEAGVTPESLGECVTKLQAIVAEGGEEKPPEAPPPEKSLARIEARLKALEESGDDEVTDLLSDDEALRGSESESSGDRHAQGSGADAAGDRRCREESDRRSGDGRSDGRRPRRHRSERARTEAVQLGQGLRGCGHGRGEACRVRDRLHEGRGCG